MYILGINAYHADSSAAILKDGVVMAAVEEERFTRVKHWVGFPSQSILFCLQEAGISLRNLDHITIGRDSKAKYWRKMFYALRNPSVISNAFGQLRERRKFKNIEGEFSKVDATLSPDEVSKRIRGIEHHRSHLASAFFASPYNEAALLSIDGSGDFTTTMVGIGIGNKIDVFDSVDYPVSCGLFYTAFTQFLGFYNYGDEYKIMGLAPYGRPLYADKVRKIFRFSGSDLFDWDSRYFVSPTEAGFRYENNVPYVGRLFSEKFTREFGSPRGAGEALSQYHKDIAASVQLVTEEVICHILVQLRQKTNMDSVCIAGGVAQNSVANGKIATLTGFKKVYVPSAGHDAGISVGSALYLYNHLLGHPRKSPVMSAYLGPQFSNKHIEDFLNGRGINYRRLSDDDIFSIVVEELVKEGVIGWFSGRSEFGPRALGARSILADPRNPNIREVLNLKIKRRENFRPFAPSILKEYTAEYFLQSDEVPFMEKVFQIRPEKHKDIPAVTHVDGTGRLQTVDRNFAPRYYGLIDAFRKKTGIPILLNTSFNENEPIVNTPHEALDCFLRTKMDMLVLENYVIRREDNPDENFDHNSVL